jgi:hypothetical protein
MQGPNDETEYQRKSTTSPSIKLVWKHMTRKGK